MAQARWCWCALLGLGTLAGLAANDNPDSGGGASGGALQRRRLELQFGYGFPAFGDRLVSMPELGLRLSNGRREYSLSWRHDLARGGADALGVQFEARRREHEISLRLTARY